MRRFWRLWRVAGHDVRLLWFSLRHADRPAWLIPAAAVLGIYAIEPFNFAIPVLGVVDDFILLPLILHGLLRFLPAHIAADFRRSRSVPAQANIASPLDSVRR